MASSAPFLKPHLDGHLTVVSDARTIALLGQRTLPGHRRFLQRQRVAVGGVQEGNPLALRDVWLVLRDLRVPALDVPADVRVVGERRQAQVAGALAAGGGRETTRGGGISGMNAEIVRPWPFSQWLVTVNARKGYKAREGMLGHVMI